MKRKKQNRLIYYKINKIKFAYFFKKSYKNKSFTYKLQLKIIMRLSKSSFIYNIYKNYIVMLSIF